MGRLAGGDWMDRRENQNAEWEVLLWFYPADAVSWLFVYEVAAIREINRLETTLWSQEKTSCLVVGDGTKKRGCDSRDFEGGL